MRYVPRGTNPPPASLSKADRKGFTEFDHALAYYEPPPPATPSKKAYGFSAYKGIDVRDRLEELFHGKCAYCESYYASTAPVDVEHYRPKGGVEGEVHPGYWWLAATWDNLLPSCIFCNRRQTQRTPVPAASLTELVRALTVTGASLEMKSGKQNCFPISGVRAADRYGNLQLEQPLLLNPSEDRPEQFIGFNLDPDHTVGVVFPAHSQGAAQLPQVDAAVQPDQIVSHAEKFGLSVRGAVSIQVYGLNRLGLVQQRTCILRTLEFLGSLLIDLATLRDRVDLELAKRRTELLADVAAKLQELEDRIYTEIRSMKSDQAPHSAMVTAWLNSFKERIHAV